MKILTASYILTFDENFTILKDGCIVFDEKIIELASYDMTIKKYPNIEIEKLAKNSVLMPGLINSHIHLEFSGNTTTLKYGNFYSWLNAIGDRSSKMTLRHVPRTLKLDPHVCIPRRRLMNGPRHSPVFPEP